MFSVTVGVLAGFAAGSPAEAAPSVVLTSSLAENSRLGEGTVATAKLDIEGTEYGGFPPALIGATLRLPAGTVVSPAGFPTCSGMTLQNAGPAGCPAASRAGPTTSFRVAVSFGTERVPENGSVMPFFSPEGGVLLYFEAHSPAQLEFVALGHYEPPIPPFGPALKLEIPLVETVPGAPFASFKELTVGLGAFREEARPPCWERDRAGRMSSRRIRLADRQLVLGP
jgi:hypothetical protein